MVLCDLPYGVTRNSWDKPIDLHSLWALYEMVVKPNGAILLFGSGMFTAKLMLSNQKDWRYNLIWEKNQPSGFLNAKRMPMRAHEDICVFYRKLPIYNPQMSQGVRKVATATHKRNSKHGDSYGKYTAVSYDSDKRYPRSVIRFPLDTQKSALHATQKPVDLCEYLIRMYTNPGDTVLDNCMGSGSTGIACVKCGRNFIGIENDPSIYQIAAQRIKEYMKYGKECG